MRYTKNVLLTGFIISLCFIQVLDAKQKEGYVIVNKLFYRSGPGINNKKIGSLTLGAKIIIIGKSANKDTIAGKSAYWLQFKAGEKTGWVYGGFISQNKPLSKQELMTRLKGSYNYINAPHNQSKILKIKGNTYIERWYTNDWGITDEFTGKVVYQADNIILYPNQRRARPSVYITYPQNDEESSIYNQAYHSYDRSPGRLKFIRKLSVKEGQRKLVLVETDKHIILVTEQDHIPIMKMDKSETAKKAKGYIKKK